MAPLPPSEQKDNLPPASDPLSDLADWTHTLPDADSEENEETLARMVNILDYAEGFTLLFARCNFPALRRQLEDAAEATLAFRNVRVIRINLTGPVANIRHLLRDELLAATKSTETDLYDNSQQVTDSTHAVPALHESKGTYVAETSAANPKLILFLSGLELSIPYDDPNTPALAQLNLGRDFFPRELPHPLLIWLPDYAVTAVSRYAPDFWSWRSGLFEFEGTQAERTDTLQRYAREGQGWSKVSNLSAEEKLARQRLLESLLDDYVGQNMSTREISELADLYISLGEICHAQENAKSALHYYEQALSLARIVNNQSNEARILNNIGGVYDELGEKAQALIYFEQTLPLRRASGDQQGEAATLNNIGGIYYDLNRKEQAIDNFEQTLKLFRATNNQRGEATALNNIGMVYSNMGEKSRALALYKQALALSQSVGDRVGEATTFHNIGVLYTDMGESVQALANFEKALAFRRSIGDHIGTASTLNNISQMYIAQGDYETALRFLEQALIIQQDIGDVAGLCSTLISVGHIHWQTEEYKQAVVAWVTVYRLASQNNVALSLQALTGLAEQLGLEGGLDGWAALAARMAEGEG